MAPLYTPNLAKVPVVNQMVSGEISLQNAIAYLAELDVDCLLVEESGRLQGWLTGKDVVKLAAQGMAGDDCTLGMVMTQPPYILNPEEARDLYLVLYYLQKYRVHQLPVVADNGDICGLVTAQGIMPLCSQQFDYLRRLEIQIDQSINAQTEQDHFLQEITDSVPGVLYIYDLEKQCNVYSNKNIASYLGYTPQEIQQMGSEMFSIIIEPEDLPKVLAREKIIATTINPDDQHWQLEYRIRHADGSCRWFSTHSRPFRYYPDGRIKQTIGVAQDITDRKQIEQELQDNQHLLSSMIQAIPGIVYLHDLQTQHNIYMNDAGLDFFGYTREQINELGSNFVREIIHPEDLVYLTLLSIQNLAKGEAHKCEYRLKSAQGEWRWHLKQTIVFKSTSEGVPQQILGVIIDIHDRKQIEIELQSSQHFLQTVADTIPGILYIYDLEANRNVYINSLAPEILGYTKAQIDKLGNNLLGQIIHPEDLVINIPLVMEQLAQGAIAKSEYRLKNAQGEWLWCLEYTNIFQASAEGVPQKILGIVIDIHDHKLAEAALQQLNIKLDQKVSERTQELWQTNINLAHEINEKVKLADHLQQQEEFFRAVFEQAAVGINIASRDGKLVKVNQKICQMLGYTEAELLAMTWMDLTASEFVAVGLEYNAKRDRGEISSYNIEKQVIRKDGSRMWVNTTVCLLRDSLTNIIYDLAITQAISDRKAAEDQLQANLQEKELLLKEIHHRVKNNLQVISSILTLQCHNITDPAIVALFEDSQTRIYAIALIHEHLYKTTQFEQINFAEYVKNLVFYLSQLYGSFRNPIQIQTNIVEIMLNIETAIPCSLIITELVINALKYAFPRHGSEQLITIELQRLSDRQLSLSVKDNGIGIPSDYDLAEINTLGLSLVKMLTQQLEGEITLTCNSGTQFVIMFHELKYSRRLYVPENS